MASILYSNEKNLLLLRCSLCFLRRFFGCWLLCWLGGLWFFGGGLLCWFGGLCPLWALGLVFFGSLVQLEASGSSGSLGLNEFLLLDQGFQSLANKGAELDNVNLVVGGDVFLDGREGRAFGVLQGLDGGHDHGGGRGVGRLGLGLR